MGRYLDDLVWAQLDPHAGRLTRRQCLHVAASALATAVALAAGLLVWRTGTVVPRVTADRTSGWTSSYDTDTGTLTIELPLHNAGNRPVTITGAGRDSPGALFVRAAPLPLVLPPAATVPLRLTYQITDCRAPLREDPVPLRITRPWATVTITVHPPDPWWEVATSDLPCHNR